MNGLAGGSMDGRSFNGLSLVLLVYFIFSFGLGWFSFFMIRIPYVAAASISSLLFSGGSDL